MLFYQRRRRIPAITNPIPKTPTDIGSGTAVPTNSVTSPVVELLPTGCVGSVENADEIPSLLGNPSVTVSNCENPIDPGVVTVPVTGITKSSNKFPLPFEYTNGV